MAFSFQQVSFQKRLIYIEILFLFILCVVVPIATGLQIWGRSPFVLCLVFLNCLHIPSIMFLYRIVIPAISAKKGWRYFWLAPLFIILYELNARLSYLLAIEMPFISTDYKNNNLRVVHPENFSVMYTIQNFGYTFLVVLAASSLFMVRRLLKNQHKLYELQTDKIKLELTHLKSQVQPHFFFNTLNNLYSMSIQGSPKTAPMIADLSSIMRYVLYETENEKVSLQKEVDFIKSFIELESIRYDGPEIIDFSIQGAIAGIQIEPMLFLPLVENCFKHALRKDVPGKWIKMILSADTDEIIFQTSNLKKNKQSAPSSPGNGIGLKNVRKRLELLYPGRHQLLVYDKAESFMVTLMIDIKTRK